MESNPLITVITASYYSQYLYDAIDSVLAQTYPNIEYIVTDDGTKDFDVQTVTQYIEQNKKTNISSCHVIHHTENLGTVKNLNFAMKASHGEYIFHLAADDLYADAHVLSKWLRDMQCNNSLLSTACFCKYNKDFSEDLFIFPFEYQKQLLRSRNNKKIFHELAMGNFIYGCSTARSRECLNMFGFYDEKYHLVEDYPYALNYVRQGGRIDLFDHVCIKYRQGGSSSSDRFGVVYENDSDQIFQNEILPYVKWKFLYRLIYFQWKKNQKTGFWENARTKSKIQKLFLYLKNPIQIGISLQRSFQKLCCMYRMRR